jgi:hypothetical protein
MSVPPPPGGLGSNSNYIFTANCSPITGLTVTIDIMQDVVHHSSNAFWYSGFGFQLNCYSPKGNSNAWQQLIFAILKSDIGPTRLCWVNNDWTPSQDVLVDDIADILTLPNIILPAGYQLQMQLTNDAKDNIVGVRWIVNDLGVLPAPTTPITGYWRHSPVVNTPPSLTEQHVNYIGIDGHIHERVHYITGNWVHNDLTVLSGNSTLPASGSALDAYAGPSGGQHVNYIGADAHVHELYIPQGGSAWINNDLTQLSKGILPRPGTPLDGYIDNDNAQHVNFIGTDNHVHELLIRPDGHWIDNDLIKLSGNGIGPRPQSPLDGYLGPDGGQHVNFIGTDGHVHELYILPQGHWVNNDLNHLSGNSMIPSRTSSLCGYLGPDNGQHVNFIGTEGHVRELYIVPNSNWVNNDLTQLSGNGIAPAPQSPLCGYWASGNTQHVNFIGTDGQVHELYIVPHGHWVNNDLNVLSGNSIIPASNSALHSYAQPNGDQHVNYIGANDTHLHELYIHPGGKWVNNDLNHLELINIFKDPLDLSGNFAPINAFQLNLVGPVEGASAVLSSGAGSFIYSAGTPLTVQDSVPTTCTSVSWSTAETANSFYGSLDAGPSNLFTQTFTTSATTPMIHAPGPIAKGVTIPRQPGQPIKPLNH